MKYAVTIKTIVSIAAITAVIIAISILANQILYRDSGKLVQSIEKAEDSVRKNNWEQAATHIEQITETWEHVKGIWSALVDHQEIDNIDVTISRLQALIKTRDAPSVLSESAAMKKYVNHIPNKEKLSLDNVF